MTTFVEGLLAYVGFFFVTVASSQLAIVFPKIKLPLITGYLFVGVLAGPYVLNFVTSGDIKVLAYINQFVLAFIGFSAGAELYLPELRELFKLILLSVGTISVVTFIVVTLIVQAMMNGGMVDFVDGFSSNCIFGISLLFGAIMTARSPASAIAIVKETRAKGPFTKSFLGVTVVSDLVVLVLFAMAMSICRAQCDGKGFNWESIGTMIFSIVFSILFGYFVLGKLVVFLLYLKPHVSVSAKWLIIPLGFGLFLLNGELADFTLNTIGHEFSIEPLLMCIVAGYVATNQSRNRRFFLAMLQKVGPYVFIPFFTLTGAGLNLKVLVSTFPLAAAVSAARMTTIAIGSVIGGEAARAPRKHNIWMWMALVTQAGVSLGLAGEIAFMFTWGPSCATTIIGVILINQIVGPILCKLAIKKVGEDGKAGAGEGSTGLLGVRNALLFGVNEYTLNLADKLQRGHWKVRFYEVPGTNFDDVIALNAKNVPKEEEEDNNTEMLPTMTDAEHKQQPVDPKAQQHNKHAKHHEEEEEEEEKIWEIKMEYLKNIPVSQEEAASHNGQIYDFAEASKDTHKSQDVVLLSLKDDDLNLEAAQYFTGQKFSKIIAVVSNPVAAQHLSVTGVLPLYMNSAFESLLLKFVTSNDDQVSLKSLVKGSENVGSHLHKPDQKVSIQVSLKSLVKGSENVGSHLHKPDQKVSIQVEEPSQEEETKTDEPEAKGVKKIVQKSIKPFKDAASQMKGGIQKSINNMPVVEDDQREEYLDALAEVHTVQPLMTFSLFDANQKANAPITTDKKNIEESFRSSYSVFDEYNQMTNKDEENH